MANAFQSGHRTTHCPKTPYSMADALRYVAKLGGCVEVSSDGNPGLKVVWIGLNNLFFLNAYRDFI